MPPVAIDLLAITSGSIVGLVLGLVGGGGSILAVPLLVYLVGVSPTHVAIGTSALAVSGSAVTNLVAHARAGNVKWPCAAIFSGAGLIGALIGAEIAKALDGQRLLLLFGLLMIVVGLAMFRRPAGGGNPNVRLTTESARSLLPLLLGIGFLVGALSGFFGIGGGFLIVPGLMLATGMSLTSAVGTSLVAVAVFGAATAASYAASGLIDWSIATLFILGGVIGGGIGVAVGRMLAQRRRALTVLFASLAVLVGIYIAARGLLVIT